jgi:peptidylprolyl isomerase
VLPDMQKKTAALLAVSAIALSLPIAGCTNDEGFRRDDSSLDLDSSTKVPKELTEVKDAPARKAGEPLPEQKNVTGVSTDLSKKPDPGKPSGDAPEELQASDVVTGTGAEAKSGDEVEVQYVGVLFADGKEFDSSWKRDEPFKFTLGQGEVIKGWDEGVAGMKVGGRRVLVIPSDLAYGPQGSPPSIPADAPLVFVVDLKKVGKGK